ncbi:MAG: hypothetical protein NT113_24415 [Hyphomicrobiales bacterium]|jgi:hypothetical protein|nr:hypothetical protein [Hyphomicrobiales bacterium]
MTQMILIDSAAKNVRLMNAESSARRIAKFIGRPVITHRIPSGDALKVSASRCDRSFKIGGSQPFSGNAVIVLKTSVNASNPTLLLQAIRDMVSFEVEKEENVLRRGLSNDAMSEQLELWPVE